MANMSQSDPDQGRGQQVPLHHGGRAARQAAPERGQAAGRGPQPQGHPGGHRRGAGGRRLLGDEGRAFLPRPRAA